MLSLRLPDSVSPRSWRLAGGVATTIAGFVAVCLSISLEEQAPVPDVRSQLRTAQPSPIVIAAVAIFPEANDELAELAAEWIVPPPPVYALFVPRPPAPTGPWSV